MNAAVEKFEQFEWLIRGTTAKSPNFEPVVHGTNEKPLTYQDKLGAIASMDTKLAKAIASVIVFGPAAKADFDHVQEHLANIMILNAVQDKRREPEGIKIKDLAKRVAFMVIQFALEPTFEDNFTAKGRLHLAAGVRESEMSLDCYRMTWKQYENLMTLAIESAIDEASKAIKTYKKNTYKEFEA